MKCILRSIKSSPVILLIVPLGLLHKILHMRIEEGLIISAVICIIYQIPRHFSSSKERLLREIVPQCLMHWPASINRSQTVELRRKSSVCSMTQLKYVSIRVSSQIFQGLNKRGCFPVLSKGFLGGLVRLCNQPQEYSIGDSIFQNCNIRIMEDDSSIPPLPLSTVNFPPPPRLHNELKQRMSSQLTLTDILQLPPITEQTTDRLSTDRSAISLAQIRTLRAMRINALHEMTEDECLARYAKDPFFRRKVQSEVRSLHKACSHSQLPGVNIEPSPIGVQMTMRLIEQEQATTFRKVMEGQCVAYMANKNKLEHVMSQVHLRIRPGKENGGYGGR